MRVLSAAALGAALLFSGAIRRPPAAACGCLLAWREKGRGLAEGSTAAALLRP